MRQPITSTYRLQLRGPGADPSGRAFGFAEAVQLIPYLRSLGVSHLYLSPIFTAMPDSNHGYDVLDPTEINPQLGGIDGLRTLAAEAKEAGLGLIADIVPNHVGVEVPRYNRWWWDVLKHGQESEYASFFDIDWHEDNGAGGKLGMPVLGKEGDETELRLVHLPAEEFPAGMAPEGEDVLAYFDKYFPLRPGSYDSTDDDPQEVYARQAYRLMFWRDGVISYRRFFSVNGLAGVRQEDPLVFEHTHRLLRQLIAEDLLDGVRVDHPDGLTDPFGYLSRLRELIGPDRWLVVEKILEVDEPLDPRLRVDGTTGYDAMRELDGIFLNRSAEDTLSMLALQQSGSTWDDEAIAASAQQLKRDVASSELAAEVRRLVRAIRRDNFAAAATRTAESAAADSDERRHEVSDEELASTVIELVAAMPVYRADYRSLSRITSTVIAEMSKRFPSRRGALDLISAAFLASGEAKNRFAQVCGAVMAKGVEDTLFYRASRLVALQEVGGAPGRFGVGAAEFHLLQDERASLWPQAMTALSTHDTKRSEDTRARILEYAEVPNDFAELVRQVMAMVPPPDAATGHFLLQNILGVWPHNGDITDALQARLHAYAMKAVREAALHTTWFDQNERYEHRVIDWVDAVLYGPAAAKITEFVGQLHPGAVQVSLGRKLLQLVGPGVPDTYQGQEFVQLTLVDPDNRAFVDYTARAQALQQYDQARAAEDFSLARFLYGEEDPSAEALAEAADWAKQCVTAEGLRLRKALPEVFQSGTYRAVYASGAARHHLVGMARGHANGEAPENTQVIGLATREPLKLARTGGWGETFVALPQGTWVDRLTGTTFSGTAALTQLFAALPVALLVRAEHV